MHFWRYCKDMQTPYFGYFEDAWLATPRMIISTCRKLWFLSASQKQTSSFTFFLRYHMLKNPAIWLTERILAHNSRTRILPGGKMPRKINDNFFKKILLWGIWALFPKIKAKVNFPEKKPYQFLDIPIINSLAKNQKKLWSHFWEKSQTDGRTDRQTDHSDFIGPSVGGGSNKKGKRQLWRGLSISMRYLPLKIVIWRILFGVMDLIQNSRLYPIF